MLSLIGLKPASRAAVRPRSTRSSASRRARSLNRSECSVSRLTLRRLSPAALSAFAFSSSRIPLVVMAMSSDASIAAIMAGRGLIPPRTTSPPYHGPEYRAAPNVHKVTISLGCPFSVRASHGFAGRCRPELVRPARDDVGHAHDPTDCHAQCSALYPDNVLGVRRAGEGLP